MIFFLVIHEFVHLLKNKEIILPPSCHHPATHIDIMPMPSFLSFLLFAAIFFSSSLDICELQPIENVINLEQPQKTFAERLEVMKAKLKRIGQFMVSGENAENSIEKKNHFHSLWAEHRLFQEAMALQKMMGNYCKGEQHYKKHFLVNLNPLEKAVAELAIHGSDQHVKNEGDKAALIRLLLDNAKGLKKQASGIEQSVKAYYKKSGVKLGLDKEIDWAVKRHQFDFDISIKNMANAMEREECSNPFERLSRAEELLELAVNLWTAIVDHNKKDGKQKVEETEHAALIIAYNMFARKLERFIDNGAFSRDLHGNFDMAKFDQMMAAEQMKNEQKDMEHFGAALNADFLMLIRELLIEHYQLSFPQMDVLKIRGDSHIVLSNGLIEYHFTYEGAKRLKFKEHFDDYTSECSPGKAREIVKSGLVKLSETDSVFYKMVQHGWDDTTFGTSKGKDCRTFVWNFLCTLFNGNCPRKEQFPPGFLHLDRNELGSVFKESKLTIPIENQAEVIPQKENCKLKMLDLTFQFMGNEQIDTHKLDSLLPLLVEYNSGNIYYYQLEKKFISVQQMVEINSDEMKMEENFSMKNMKGEGNHQQIRSRYFMVRELFVYSCNVKGKEKAVVRLQIDGKKLRPNKIAVMVKIPEEKEWKESLYSVDLMANPLIQLKLSPKRSYW